MFVALLSLVAAGGALLTLVTWMVSRRVVWLVPVVAAVRAAGLWLAFVVAAGSSAGSLWFSEVAGFVPCQLCWFQRVAMYPLSVVLLVAALRRDRGVVWYVVPVAVLGALVAGWHYVVEWRPSLEGGVCGVSGPSCAAVWFREFGFVTLALMALLAFAAVVVFTCAASPREGRCRVVRPG